LRGSESVPYLLMCTLHDRESAESRWPCVKWRSIVDPPPHTHTHANTHTHTHFPQVRVMRPLKTLNKLQGLRVIVLTLLDSVPELAQALALIAFLLTVFAIVGVQVR
jgi:hypothetical protein